MDLEGLIKKSEEIVGDVGEESDMTHSATGEEFVEFACYGRTEEEVAHNFLWWVDKYKQFSKYYFKLKIYNGEKQTLYWRKKPEIEHVRSDKYTLYARLLITHLKPKA